MHRWENWHEPNNINFWKPAPSPIEYTEMLKLAYDASKRANSSSITISAGLSPAVNKDGNIAPYDFVKSMYEYGTEGKFDALGFHPYCYHRSFNCPTEYAYWSAWSQMSKTSDNIRDLILSNGDGNKKIWITEFGAPIKGKNSISKDQQAEMVKNVHHEVSSVDWIGSVYCYSLQDPEKRHQQQ